MIGGLLGGITDAIGLTNSGAIKDAYKNATAEQRVILERLDAIDLPDEEKLRVILQSPELVGLLEVENIPESTLAGFREDAALQNDTRLALESLRDRASQGVTEQDKAQLEQAVGAISAQEKAQRASMDQEAARQGISDSGISAAAKISSAQNLANQGRQQALQMVQQGAQNRMAASQALGQTAGNLQQQQFGRAEAVATAQDRIAQANAMNRQNIAGQNLASRQNIANQKTNVANQQQLYNAGLEQQRFQNEMSKAGSQGQAQQNIANQFMGQAQAQAQSDQAVMGALIQGGAMLAGKPPSDKNVKINVEDGKPAIRQLLDKLKPYEYDYKPEVVENAGDLGKQIGVMAQDLEKSELGKEFVIPDGNGVKRVDYGKMGSTQLAAIADVNDRVNKMELLLSKLGIKLEDM